MVDLLKNTGQLTGIHIEKISLQEDFLDLAGRFAHLPGTVLLASGGDLDCSRYHILGTMPWLTLSGGSKEVRLAIDDHHAIIEKPPLEVLKSTLEQFSLPENRGSLPMVAGLMGYLAYDLKDGLEDLPKTAVDDLHLPHMLFYAPSIIVVHDRQNSRTQIMVPQRISDPISVDQRISDFKKTIENPAPETTGFGADAAALQSNFSQKEYQNAVRRVIDYITAGDVYQVNLSQRFQAPFNGDGFALFRHLFDRNPAPFFAFIQAGDHQVVSTSPERFLLRNGNKIETRPIKGTRPRGSNEEADLVLRKDLAQSKKDDAELSMIVDLLRNDLGKVCAAGSVKVAEHKRLETYENVYHLVSIVEGELDDGKGSVDLIEATFPGGSITGCPKVRSMEIIDELESHRRHIYCGSIGYLSFHDTMDLSIAIRTATILNGTISFSVGGGIVYDSDPLSEYEETLHKGETLSTACQGNRHQSRVNKVWLNGRLIDSRSATVPIEDQGLLYGYGFFETIRVDNGRIPLLNDHLNRFKKTWQAMMPAPLPDLTWHDIITQVVEANHYEDQCCAIKILATRGSRTAPPWDHALLVAARPYIHRLKAVNAEGIHLGTYPHPRQTPLAGHKTLNYLYYLQAGQWAQLNGFHEAIILNPDGTISESNTANLLLINDKEVIRPQSPAVLPGVMTQAITRQLRLWGYTTMERPVEPDELRSADTLLATNALMGAVPVIRIDNQSRPAGSNLCEQLNDAIIPEWRK